MRRDCCKRVLHSPPPHRFVNLRFRDWVDAYLPTRACTVGWAYNPTDALDQDSVKQKITHLLYSIRFLLRSTTPCLLRVALAACSPCDFRFPCYVQFH
jgi:hypothetical protein